MSRAPGRACTVDRRDAGSNAPLCTVSRARDGGGAHRLHARCISRGRVHPDNMPCSVVPVVQRPRTPLFQGWGTHGPSGMRWALECAPRARTIDKLIQNVPLVKRPITPPFQGGGRGFESHTGRQPSLRCQAKAVRRSAKADVDRSFELRLASQPIVRTGTAENPVRCLESPSTS
jgi:hypothetical protein